MQTCLPLQVCQFNARGRAMESLIHSLASESEATFGHSTLPGPVPYVRGHAITEQATVGSRGKWENVEPWGALLVGA